MLSGQLQNLSRALQQLQSGYMAAARLEAQLRGELPADGFDFTFVHVGAPLAIHHAPAVAAPKASAKVRS